MAAVTERLPDGVALVRASNAGPMTLSGTNTWIVGEPAWVIDPGPAEPAHVDAVVTEVERRGGRHRAHARAPRSRGGGTRAA